jgi:RNA polymerase II subunit A-like phosphatase
LTISDYTGSETTRATINLTHDSRGVKISQHEAERIENEHVKRLLNVKKLSMLLDLDQTVVHATVDDQVKGWLEDPGNEKFPRVCDVFSFVLPDSPVVYYIKLR